MSLAMLEIQFREPLARAFQKVPLGPEEEPGEDRVVVGRTSWEQYVAMDEERGASSTVTAITRCAASTRLDSARTPCRPC